METFQHTCTKKDEKGVQYAALLYIWHMMHICVDYFTKVRCSLLNGKRIHHQRENCTTDYMQAKIETQKKMLK